MSIDLPVEVMGLIVVNVAALSICLVVEIVAALQRSRRRATARTAAKSEDAAEPASLEELIREVERVEHVARPAGVTGPRRGVAAGGSILPSVHA